MDIMAEIYKRDSVGSIYKILDYKNCPHVVHVALRTQKLESGELRSSLSLFHKIDYDPGVMFYSDVPVSLRLLKMIKNMFTGNFKVRIFFKFDYDLVKLCFKNSIEFRQISNYNTAPSKKITDITGYSSIPWQLQITKQDIRIYSDYNDYIFIKNQGSILPDWKDQFKTFVGEVLKREV